MKQIILILNIVFFCSFLTTAQKTISKKDFESLVDYANCKYIMAFIEKYDVGKPYFKDTYEKNVKPELEKAALDNFETIPNYQNISELLANNDPALKLAETINGRKEKYENAKTNEKLIQELKATKWKDIDLIPTAETVLNSIYKKFKIEGGTTAQEIVQEQTIQTSAQVEQLQSKFTQLQQQNDKLSNDTKIKEYQKSLEILKLTVLGAAFLMVILFVIILYLLKAKSREYIIKQVLDSYRIKEKFTQFEQKKYSLNEHDINTIANRVLESKLLNEKETQHHPKPSKKEIIDNSKPVVKYLKGKSGKIFNRAENSSDNSFFKLFNETDDAAMFEFCGDVAEALAKRIFSEDICTIVSGNYQNARSIQTSKPGKIKRVGEQWEVIEPIQIKLT